MTSAELSCPLCCHNSKRYELVDGSCKTVAGFNTIQNVIQHLIKCHLHICRRCKQEFKPKAKDPIKSQVQYKKMLNETPKHKTCFESDWPAGRELKTPEILTERQQEVVLSWSQNEVISRLRQDHPESLAGDAELWVDLYRQLFRDCPSIPDPRSKYWIAHHEVAAEREALKSTEMRLKRKLSDVTVEKANTDKKLADSQKELENLRRQLADAHTQLMFREQTVEGVWNPNSTIPDMTAEDRDMLFLEQRVLSEMGIARMGSGRHVHATTAPPAGNGTVEPYRLQLQPPRTTDKHNRSIKSHLEASFTQSDPTWPVLPDSGIGGSDDAGDRFD